MREKKISVAHKHTVRKQIIFWSAAIVLTLFSWIRIGLDKDLFFSGLQKIPNVVRQMMKISPGILPEVLQSMVLTLAIAAIGILISAVIALVLGFLIAENTAPSKFGKWIISSVCIVIRTIPITVWVLLAVASAGFGATSAVLGLALPTISYLAKTFANQIETCGKNVGETMKALGCSWPVAVLRGFFPMCKSSLAATCAFRFEMSVSESTVLGLVGCQGIGYLISRYIKAYKFGELSVCLLVVLAVMYGLELGTARLRKQLRKESHE